MKFIYLQSIVNYRVPQKEDGTLGKPEIISNKDGTSSCRVCGYTVVDLDDSSARILYSCSEEYKTD